MTPELNTVEHKQLGKGQRSPVLGTVHLGEEEQLLCWLLPAYFFMSPGPSGQLLWKPAPPWGQSGEDSEEAMIKVGPLPR